MPYLPTDHTFIIRFWLERRENPDVQPEWRGMIEYVLTRERRYFFSMEQITNFIREKIVPDPPSAER
jgi:hypothetical protein